jgi:translocation protein SEC62
MIGKHAVNALLRDSYSKTKCKAVADRTEAETLVSALHKSGLFLQVKKEPKSKILKLSETQTFSPDSYFVWIYVGSQMFGTLMGIGVLLVAFAGVLFPLWPASLRQGVYYLSLVLMGLLGTLMGLGVIRLILWLILVINTGKGGWLFPNLFADVGIIESFIPLWA